ncbi:MAG: ADP/ATP-dependent (S)-NAD(P)H-hydrate dehydratase [Rhizobiaceae bacterium]
METNSPELWQSALPVPSADDNKYHRGYVAIYAAPELTGATRLAASACNRIGAGLVSVVAEKNADIYRTCLPPDIMVPTSRPAKSSVLLGGSGGISENHFRELLGARNVRARIFDADALPADFNFDQLDESCILTPHFGEFGRVFGPVNGDPAGAALRAAKLCGAHVVLKSARTIIASPDGRIVANDHASPYLAKAGTGDVLAGLIAGLVAQGMPHFLATSAAVWIHGEAAIRFGPGFVASDIPEMVPAILRHLLAGTIPEWG